MNSLTPDSYPHLARLIWYADGVCPGSRGNGLTCGCGDPAEAFVWIRDALAACDGEDNWTSWGTFMDKAPPGAREILAYHLGSLGLVEHGSSWRGAWLTTEGKELLAETRHLSAEEIEQFHDANTGNDGRSVTSCRTDPGTCPNCQRFGGVER